jgi:ubiquinone/menaquinone biosynthesis C-methylase UbiE
LCGKGIEIGALNAPCKVAPGATVTHVDSKSTEDLIKYYGREMHGLKVTPVDLVADAHTLAGIENSSQDFAIANQVLEHLENPLLALENMLRVVRTGGVVFLSLPDKRYTFDAARPVTPFAHILEDYRVGPEKGREAHYREWMELVEKVPESEAATRLFFLMNVQNYPIHFHVWSQFEMCELFDRARAALPYSYEIDCFKANDAEALFVLRRL